jgi:hypothetical protein
MSQVSSKPNRQVQRTKSWVFEAVMLLMDEKSYDKITVSDITEKAGIARQTFYRNYKDKDDVIIQYFSKIFNDEMLSVEKSDEKNKPNNIVLTFNIKYMVKHHVNLKKIMRAVDIENLFSNKLNEWQELLASQNKSKLNSNMQFIYRYKIYYQITGILKVIMDWFKNDMPISVDDLVKLLNYFTVDTESLYISVPNIKIQITDN